MTRIASDNPSSLSFHSSTEKLPFDTDAADTGDSKAAEDNSTKNIELPESPIIPRKKRLRQASGKGIIIAENPADPSLEDVSSSFAVLHLLHLFLHENVNSFLLTRSQ